MHAGPAARDFDAHFMRLIITLLAHLLHQLRMVLHTVLQIVYALVLLCIWPAYVCASGFIFKDISYVGSTAYGKSATHTTRAHIRM